MLFVVMLVAQQPQPWLVSNLLVIQLLLRQSTSMGFGVVACIDRDIIGTIWSRLTSLEQTYNLVDGRSNSKSICYDYKDCFCKLRSLLLCYLSQVKALVS